MSNQTNPVRQENGETIIDAVAHVGPTLEAEALNTTSGASTPEHQITADLEPQAIDIQAITDSLTGDPQTQTSATIDQNIDDPLQSSANGRVTTGPERLKTRLPGDTSSDPHTDH